MDVGATKGYGGMVEAAVVRTTEVDASRLDDVMSAQQSVTEAY